MKFRLVWMGPEDEPNRVTSKRAPGPQNAAARVVYEQRGAEMVRLEHLASGRVRIIPIANFTARIVRDLILDDDVETRREFGLEVDLGDDKFAFILPAAEFARMGWVLRKIGPQAIVYPGQQQHARAAIQWLSRRPVQERIFAHLGWKKQGAEPIYLHAAGAVGPNGTQPEVQVRLPEALSNFEIHPLVEAGDRVNAVRASLRFLSLAPDRITFPLFASIYRAPFGKTDFSIFVTGQTGTFKTNLAALCQQHFGAELDAGRLPANFASTANALESLAFTAKDTLLVVDDFVPLASPGDRELQSVAERLFRGAGNRQGRSRMGTNGQLRSSRPPRAFILATGEEVPRGHSLRARLLIVEVAPGDVERYALNQCQQAGREGHLAAAMGAFLSWVASRYEQLQIQLESRSRELRQRYQGAIHARLPGALAELQSGFEIWLQFALEIGAIDAAERGALEMRNLEALNALAIRQIPYHQSSDPALRFISLLRAALANGRAHVADHSGKKPETPESWGWRRRQGGHWLAQGTRIGWVSGNDLFLDPIMSYQVVQQMAGAERIPLTEQTLRRRLKERGMLASVDAGRQMLQVRRTLEKRPRQVLHLSANQLL